MANRLEMDPTEYHEPPARPGERLYKHLVMQWLLPLSAPAWHELRPFEQEAWDKAATKTAAAS